MSEEILINNRDGIYTFYSSNITKQRTLDTEFREIKKYIMDTYKNYNLELNLEKEKLVCACSEVLNLRYVYIIIKLFEAGLLDSFKMKCCNCYKNPLLNNEKS